ncbi:MAG: hypothetical protein KAI84_08605, partial [Gammaproteobacteria bacterium]|nr:hypothetical protein [Gammaproteobacteria bacterium]
MKRILLLILCFWAVSSSAQEIPKNAHKNTYGTGWECDRGYYKSGNKCLQVQIPENAQLNYYGHGWECKHGFCKSGNKCLSVQIPKNAQLNYYGHGWECKRGFYKSGDQCLKVTIPGNGKLNYMGNGWECESGFKKSGNICVAMTQQEIRKQKEVEQAFRIEMERRRLQGVSGDDCETEYKTGAEVCVEITGVDIDCNKSYTGDYYRDCDVTLNYEVQTDYKGGSYIEVEVECTVEIEYKGRQTYTTQSDTSYADESHSLYAHGSESGTMNFNFSFSSFKEITNVKISSAECE